MSWLANPGLQLIAGSGWMNAPKLKAIAPHRAEQAEALVALGGRRFRKATSPDIVAMALSSSTTRRKLYEEGKCQPAEHGLMVKRRDMLRWAQSAAARERSAP